MWSTTLQYFTEINRTINYNIIFNKRKKEIHIKRIYNAFTINQRR